jgi:hypothetical protein
MLCDIVKLERKYPLPRFCRILAELSGPPILGAGLVVTFMLIQYRDPDPLGFLGFLPVIFGFGIIVALPLSVSYTILMELAFALGLPASSWIMVAFSGLLGGLAGCFSSPIYEMDMRLLVPDGLFVGIAIGLFIKHFSTPEKRHGRNYS